MRSTPLSRGAVIGSLVALALVACSPTPTTPPSEDALGRSLDDFFTSWNRDDGPGVAVVLLRDGEVLYRRGFGLASLAEKTPVDPGKTLFDLGSVSKQMTAYAVLLLERRGALELDQDIRELLLWVPDLGGPVTLRQLLWHTSGVREYLDLVSLHQQEPGPVEQETVRRWLEDQRDLSFPPGTQHLYSNTGYVLLAEAVAAASGQSYHDFMRQEIFLPLGLEQTRVRRFGVDGERLSTGSYGRREGAAAWIRGRYQTVPVSDRSWGSSAVASTADDLARWLEHLRLANEDWMPQLLERGRLADGRTFDYGAGIRPSSFRGQELYYHAGATMAFRSWAGFLPESGLTLVLLGNSFPGIGGLEQRVLATVFDQLDLGTDAVQEPWKRDLEPWVGHYAEDTFRVRLFTREDELVLASPQRQQPVRLLANDRFEWSGTEFEAEAGADGRMSSLRFYYGAQEVTLRRFEPPDPSTLDLETLAGTYHSPELGVMATLEATPEGLVARLEGREQLFVPTLPGRFHIATGRASSLAFTSDTAGEVTRLLWNLTRSRNLRFDRVQ